MAAPAEEAVEKSPAAARGRRRTQKTHDTGGAEHSGHEAMPTNQAAQAATGSNVAQAPKNSAAATEGNAPAAATGDSAAADVSKAAIHGDSI